MNYIEALRDKIADAEYAARKWVTARLTGYLAGRGIHLSREWVVQRGESGGPAIDELYVLVVVWDDGSESLVTGRFTDDFWRYIITPNWADMEEFTRLEIENDGVFHREPGPRMEVRRFDGPCPAATSSTRFSSGELITVLREGPQ